MIPADIITLKESGFMAIRMSPTMWHIRGIDEPWSAPPRYVSLYPFQRKYRWVEMVKDYIDPVAAVASHLKHFELPAPEQAEALRVWRAGLDALIARYPQVIAN